VWKRRKEEITHKTNNGLSYSIYIISSIRFLLLFCWFCYSLRFRFQKSSTWWWQIYLDVDFERKFFRLMESFFWGVCVGWFKSGKIPGMINSKSFLYKFIEKFYKNLSRIEMFKFKEFSNFWKNFRSKI
jgi:hypothetical protein